MSTYHSYSVACENDVKGRNVPGCEARFYPESNGRAEGNREARAAGWKFRNEALPAPMAHKTWKVAYCPHCANR
jgi:hypothetical protein